MYEEEVQGLSELKSMIGLHGEPTPVEIEKGTIRRLAEAIDDSNPLWHDEAYAQKRGYETIIAPPGMLIARILSAAGRPELGLPGKRRLDGGGEWEYFKPIKASDTITSVASFIDLQERQGKKDKLYFLIFESTHTNQNGELVAKSRAIRIFY